jgi:hypothetical protein
VASTAHGTLTANVVASVPVAPGSAGIVVVNRDQTGSIWVRIDGTDPSIGGAGSYVVLGAREFPMTRKQVQAGTVTVKMISSAARAYTVEAIG